MSEQPSGDHGPTDVFVSYRRTDREFVDALVQSLEHRGLAVWWDADIHGGHDWRESIVDKLQESQLVLLVFSEECNSSTELKKELAVAGHLKKDVVPVLIEETEPRGPYLYELAGRNWINITPDAHAKVDVLADRLVLQIGRPMRAAERPAAATAAGQAPAPAPDRSAPPDSTPAGDEPVVPDATQPAPSWNDLPPSADTLARADHEHRADAGSPDRASTTPTVDRSEIQAAIDADARPDRRDFLPFRWFDFILPALMFAVLMIPTEEDMTAIETVGLAFGFAILVLGFIGAIVFPIRYYRRRRNPYRVLAMLSLSNVVLGLGVAVGLVLARDYLNEGDEELEQLTVGEDIAISLFLGLFTFLVLSVFAFVLFWLLSKSRAARELRSNTETL